MSSTSLGCSCLLCFVHLYFGQHMLRLNNDDDDDDDDAISFII